MEERKFPLLYPGQGCKSLLSIGEDNLQFYSNFALFSTLGGMNLNHDFFQESKLSEDQKKRSSPKMERFFFSISRGGLRSDAHQSQIIGGDAGVDHTQIIGEYIPPGFRHP